MNKKRPIVVITGVSTGIGKSLAEAFAKAGYQVYGTVRKPEDAEGLKADYPEQFNELIMDVTDMDAIQVAAQQVTRECPDGIDLLINNSGIATAGPLLHLPIEKLTYQLDVNVTGVIRVCQQFVPMLKATANKPAGRIIQISSVAGRLGMPFLGPYTASKHALEGISDSLRRELRLYDIDVIVVQPGSIKTPIWNKSAEPVKEGFADTPYAKSILIFQKVFVTPAVKSGLTPEYLASRILKIARTKSPKTRYTYISKRFTNWVLPRKLPERWIDNMFAKKLFSK